MLGKPWKEEAVAEANEALEKLNRGIRKTRQMVQLQMMELAQKYFDDWVEMLKQWPKESRAALEHLPKQIPCGQEKSFQFLFRELLENYAAASEKSLDEAGKNVSSLDRGQLTEQGELNATDSARREAIERGMDLTEVEGTGSGGLVTLKDVMKKAG